MPQCLLTGAEKPADTTKDECYKILVAISVIAVATIQGWLLIKLWPLFKGGY